MCIIFFEMRCYGYYIFFSLYYIYFQFKNCDAVQTKIIITEHPSVTYINKKYANNATMISRRNSREDPRYYVSLHYDFLMPMGNNMKVLYYLCEYISPGRYSRAIIEFRSKLCDMIEKDMFLGPPVRRALFSQNLTCPFLPGDYHFTNLSLPTVPKWIPFLRGRIYLNISLANKDSTPILSGYIDMEIKSFNLPTRKNIS